MVHEVETHRRTIIEQQLVAIWCEILDIPTLGPREDIYEAGATSLDVARVAARIKKQFGRELRLKVLVEAPTVEQIAEILDSDPALDMPLVVPLRTAGSQPPLFLIPGAGGNLIVLRDLWRRLPADQSVFGIEPRTIAEEVADGRACADVQIDQRVEDIAATYLKEIAAVQPHGPYYLVGFCFGALVAQEIARLLTARGEPVAFTALLDPPLPGLRSPVRWADAPALILRFLGKSWPERKQVIATWHGRIKDNLVSRWHGLVLRASKGGKAAPGLIERRWVNLYAVTRYDPQPYAHRATVFLAIENGHHANRIAEETWSKLSPAGVDFEHVPGDHGNFIQEPHVAGLATSLVLRLQTVQRIGARG
jgi:thioesterase domain-containing protein/acyl carrier protein